MPGHIIVKCPTCQATYRLAVGPTQKHIRCKLCKTAFHVTTPSTPQAQRPGFDDTVLNWLAEIDEQEAQATPRPRIISSRPARPVAVPGRISPPKPEPAPDPRPQPRQ
jgi:hypothetical protein